MFIKQITISGFKSYRDATIAGPFSPSHNVVVGRNGSGKSNFFDAVRFVLSDTFSSLRAEERVALLHEGAGASVLSAYVEMLFDNTDGRLPSDRDEVALRRMIGLKKDEYILDRKNVTRTEVFNLLESAGFSRSNPYYIVQQGKVAALCGMTDRQRLDLLKEVAGTRVYDERREESLKIMEETDQKREKISEVVNFIESRLAELESEKEELKAFQELDKERKGLQYTIHVLELEHAKSNLEALDGKHHQLRAKGEELNARLVELRADLASAENDAKQLAPDLRRIQSERDQQDSSRKVLVERIAKLRVEVSEAAQAAELARETVRTTRAEIKAIQSQILEKENALRPLDVKFNQLRSEESDLHSQIKDLERDLLSLRVKANRSNQFTSVSQRDAHLKRTIREEKKRLTTFKSQLSSARNESERLVKTIERNESKLQEKRQELESARTSTSGSHNDVEELRSRRDEMHTRRNDIWRRIGEMDERVRDMKGHISRLEANKRAAFGSGAYHAIQAVMRFADEDRQHLGPNRVFGPLVDLIDVDPKFVTAADVTGGGTLSHVVVDTDATAARLVSLMQSRRAGRVTFIPLNRLDNDLPPAPEASPDAIPLVSKIRTDPRFMPAVHQVFNRTLVTRTVPIATELAGRYGVDCVTLEGDQVSKRGAMTGGYMDTSRSRIKASQELRAANRELGEITPELDRLKEEEASMHTQMSSIMGELQRREGVSRSASSRIARLMDDIRHLEQYILADKGNIPRAKERIKDAEQSAQTSEKTISDMEHEIGSALVSGLSIDEESRMNTLKQEIDNLKAKIQEIAPHRVAVEKQVVGLKSDLQNNLRRREGELKTMMSSAEAGDDRSGEGGDMERHALAAHESQKNALARAETDLKTTIAKLKETEASYTEKMKLYTRVNSRIEQNKDEESKISKMVEDEKQDMEKRYTERALETQKKADAEKRIRELGSLPADFDKYRGQSINSLMKKLKRTNENLKKYSHVNKKALEQYLNFTEQRDTLTLRREELDSGAAAIRSLIDSLDQRKDEDILRTFKGVSKYFSEVFSELVPGGKASLVMLKSSSVVDEGDNESGRTRGSKGRGTGRGRGRQRRNIDNRDDEQEEGQGESENEGGTTKTTLEYSGVAMKVAFISTGEAYLLQQLSGGQKSIVALALIFAIQRLDPAPFYLFDEIDANLDASHRQAVANVIRKQANQGTQFITTTFRPEFVNAGDIWFGVTHKKKVSAIQEVSREVALTFISDEPERRRR